MPLLDQIQKDMVAAMKGREEARLDALRMIKSALKKHEIDSMKPLDEATELQLLGTLIKQRRESADMFRKGNRPELADKEEAELKLIESYMPAAPTEAEVDAAIAAAMAETGVTSLKSRPHASVTCPSEGIMSLVGSKLNQALPGTNMETHACDASAPWYNAPLRR